MKTLIAFKNPAIDSPTACHQGLGITALNTAMSLRELRIEADAAPIANGENLWGRLAGAVEGLHPHRSRGPLHRQRVPRKDVPAVSRQALHHHLPFEPWFLEPRRIRRQEYSAVRRAREGVPQLQTCRKLIGVVVGHTSGHGVPFQLPPKPVPPAEPGAPYPRPVAERAGLASGTVRRGARAQKLAYGGRLGGDYLPHARRPGAFSRLARQGRRRSRYTAKPGQPARDESAGRLGRRSLARSRRFPPVSLRDGSAVAAKLLRDLQQRDRGRVLLRSAECGVRGDRLGAGQLDCQDRKSVV